MVSVSQTLQQPKALYLLSCVRMWEYFSFYGMRALLVLYMVDHLALSDLQSFSIYAIYCALVELGGVAGGKIADRQLGLKRAITLGGWFIVFGHVSLAFTQLNLFFYISLALIILGSNLLANNITTLLGLFYQGEDDPRRAPGFTFFYMGINIGALLATLLCGIVAKHWGWKYGFGLAAIGMGMGNLAFISLYSILEGKGNTTAELKGQTWMTSLIILLIGVPLYGIFIYGATFFLVLLPLITILAAGSIFYQLYRTQAFSIAQLATLAIYLTIFSLFFSAEEQIGSSIMIFSSRYVAPTFWGWNIPPNTLLSISPIVIITGGFLVSSFTKSTTNPNRRVALACILGASAFTILSVCCLMTAPSGGISIPCLVLVLAMISLAEVLLAPAIIAFCSELAPQKYQGLTLSLIPIGFSFGSLLGGFVSQSMTVDEHLMTIELYQEGFIRIAGLLTLATLVVLIILPLILRRQAVSTE